MTGESFTLYARWEAKTVTLYFTSVGSGITYPTECVVATYGEPMPTIEIPTRPGYEFLGYYLDYINYEQYYKADGTSAKIWDYVGNETALIYAHWDLGVYTVTLDVNGGDELPEVERTHRVMYTYNFTFAVPTRTGYTFLGWFDENDIQYTYSTGNHCIYVMSDVTLYAHWQAKVTEVTLETGADFFTVTFDMNGMPGEAPAPQKVTGSKGLTYVLPPVVEGYFFTGWCDASGYEFSFADRVTSDTTLYANWSAIPAEYADYTILNCNSENVIEVTPEFKYYAVYVVSGGMLYINVDKNAFICDQNAVYGAEGYRSFSLSTGEILYFRIRSANMSTDPEYTGEATLNIASALPGDGGLLSSRTFVDATYDETVSLGTPACAGYEFGGWYTEEGEQIAGPDGIAKWNLTDKTILLNARWLKKTTITFDLGTGTGTVTPGTITATYTKDLPAIEVAIEAANSNYEFVGFFSAAVGGKQYYDAKGNPTSKWDLEGDEAVFYAHYRGKKIVASFNGNGNTGGRTDNQVFYYDEEEALVANGYTKYGYDFIGWNTRVDGTGKSYTDGEVVSNLTVGDGNIILYAQWEAHRVEVTAIDYTKYYDVTVTFDLNGAPGETPAPQTVTATKGVTYPIPEIWEGHVFCGWYDNAACTGSARNMSRAFSESVTLYAKWVETTWQVLDINKDYVITITDEETHFIFYNFKAEAVTITVEKSGTLRDYSLNYEGNGSMKISNAFPTTFHFTVRTNRYHTGEAEYMGEATLRITAGAPDEGGVSISNIVERKVISYGEEFTITPASSENYDFYGYSETKGSNVLYVDESGNGLKPFEVTDVTRKNLYAVMHGKKSVITYDYCDDQHEDEGFDAYYGEGLPHPSGVTSRNGYSFKGFFTEPDGAGTKVLNESVNVVIGNWLGTEDTTFYAYWEARTYQVTLNDIPKTTCTVTFNLNDGTGGLPDPQEVGGEVALVYPETIPYREGGYRFLGWSLTSGGGTGTIYDFTQPLTNNITLYAQWYYSPHPLYQGDNTVNVRSWTETYGFASLITGDVTITVGKNAHLSCNGVEGDGTITVSCNAGYRYDLTIISYEGSNDAEYTGTTTLTISSDLPADGGTFTGTLPTVRIITFGSDDYKLDVPEAEEGKVFVGWFFRDKQYTDGEGNAIIAWDEAQNFTLYAHFEDAPE